MEKTKNDFLEKKVDDAFVSLIQDTAESDLKQISLPKDVIGQIRILDTIRKEIEPEKIDKYLVPFLMTKQTEIAGAKYLIGRHLSLMKGAQSYAYIFRKFKTASEYNKTKDRLQVEHPDKRATTNEIDSEIEKDMVVVRKTEVAYQIAGDKLECLLSWCDNMIMILQNKIRQENTAQKTGFAENNNTPNRQ